MLLPRRAGLLLVSALVVAAAGCAGDDADGGGGSGGGSGGGGGEGGGQASSGSATPSTTDASEPTSTGTPELSASGVPTVDAAELADICQAVSPEEVAQLAGLGDLVVEPLPAGSGCSYYEEGNLLNGIVSVTQLGPDEYDGTLRSLVENTAAGVDGVAEPLELGDEAFVVAGRFGEGEKADGGISAGDVTVLVTHIPEIEGGARVEDVRDVVVAVLERVAEEL